MLTFLCTLACALCGFQCVEYALGLETNSVFAAGNEWLYWLPAGGWFITAIAVFTRGTN